MALLAVDERGRWCGEGRLGADGSTFRIMAVGDICPCTGRKLDAAFSRGLDAARDVYGDVLPELVAKDLSVANLELPLSDRGEPIVKDGPNLRGPAAAIDGVLAGGFDAVTLANNHVLDFGPEPFFDTIALCRRRGLTVFGAGRDRADAARLVTMERATATGRRIRVGLLAFAENEFCNATDTTPGASPLEPGPNCNLIRRSRDQCDLLVVFVHGGNEYSPLPSPRMVRDYRAFAEAGADAVIGHHPHTVQSMELHEGVPIIYSVGNFLFWMPPEHVPTTWWLEMAVRLHFDVHASERERRCVGVDVIPVDMDRRTAHLRLLQGDERAAFCRRLNRLSRIIADADLHRRFWQTCCLKRLPHYLKWMAETRAGLDVGLNDEGARRLAAAELRNQYRCEAHHEIAWTALDLLRQGVRAGSLGVEAELDALMLAT